VFHVSGAVCKACSRLAQCRWEDVYQVQGYLRCSVRMWARVRDKCRAVNEMWENRLHLLFVHRESQHVSTAGGHAVPPRSTSAHGQMMPAHLQGSVHWSMQGRGGSEGPGSLRRGHACWVAGEVQMLGLHKDR
jgi:hypothetical protein